MEPLGLTGDRGRGGEASSRGGGRTAEVGVVAALPEEVEPLRNRMADRTRERRTVAETDRSIPVDRGDLAGTRLAVAVTGDGRRNARSGLTEFLRSEPVGRLLMAGVGAGLGPDLEPCSLVLSREVRLGSGPPMQPVRGCLEWASRRSEARLGTVVTVDEILSSPEQKSSLREELDAAGVDRGPAIADLESGHWAEVAEREGVSWLVLRGVSDDATEELPSFLDECRDEGGAVKRRSVVARAALHPASVPGLLRLRRRVRRCAERLASDLESLVGGIAA